MNRIKKDCTGSIRLNRINNIYKVSIYSLSVLYLHFKQIICLNPLGYRPLLNSSQYDDKSPFVSYAKLKSMSNTMKLIPRLTSNYEKLKRLSYSFNSPHFLTFHLYWMNIFYFIKYMCSINGIYELFSIYRKRRAQTRRICYGYKKKVNIKMSTFMCFFSLLMIFIKKSKGWTEKLFL